MSKKIVILGLAAVVAGVMLFRGGSDESATVKHQTTWNNQVWIDAIPMRDTDKIQIFAAFNDPQLGLFQNTSQWEGDYSIFTYTAKGDHGAEIELMQTGKKHKLNFKLSTKDCGRFDVCMTVKGAPRGPKTYYSMSDWVIEGSGMTAKSVAAEAWAMAKTVK